MKYLKNFLAILLCVVITLTAPPLNGFAKNEQPELKQENIQVQSSNALGNEIGELMTEQQEAENSDFCISWMDLEGKVATVEMINRLACTVVVAVFEENGKMVGSGKTEVEANVAYATVELDIATMPEYFVAKAFLLDENMASLCDEYLCERYTKAFQEFLDLTIYDFEDQIVVQLDEEVDNNFVVAKEGTQEAEQNGDKNILVSADDEAGIYVFKNADKTITGVSVGENLFYDLGNDNYILVKVESNTTEGNLTTVVADDAEIGDLFDCVKIDTVADASEATVDASRMDDAFELVDPEPEIELNAIDVEAEKKAKLGFVVKYQNSSESIKISGGFEFEAGVAIKLYYKVRLFKKDKIDFKVEAQYGYGYTLDIKSGMNAALSLPLPEVSIPVYAGITVDIGLEFVFSLEGSVGIEGKKNITTGFTYDDVNGRRTINNEEESWTPSSKGVGFEVSVGLEVSAAVSALKVVKAGVIVGVGLGLEGKIKKVDNKDGADTWHECTFCCPGEIYIFLNVKIFMDVGYKKLKVNVFTVTVLDMKFKLFDFYFSNLSSGFKTTCPNYLYKVTFVVKDDSGNNLRGVAIGDLKTDENGCCYAYYEPDTTFSINAVLSGYLACNTTVDVKKQAITVPIKLIPIKMTGISVKTLPTKTSYYTGDTLDTTGLVLTAKYNSGKTETITSGYTCTPTTLNAAGTQAVTVRYNGLTTKFNVSVTQTKATNISVTTKPEKLSYFVGDTLDTSGLVLTEKYNNGDVKTITSGYTCTPTVLETAGTQTITVKYGNNTCTYTVDVTPVVATGIAVSVLPSKLSYFVGDTLDTSGLVLTESYNNGKTVTVTSCYTCTPTVLETAGTQTVTVTYGEHSCTFDVVVTPVVATEIIVSKMPDKVTYYTGDTLDVTGLVLTEIYNNGDTVTVTSGYTNTPEKLDVAGTRTVTITYGEHTCTFDVTVIQVAPISIAVETMPAKVIYFTGDSIDTAGLVLTETYNNGDVKTITSGYTCSPETLNVAGEQTINVTYGENTCTFVVGVFDAGECSGTCGTNLLWVFEPLSGVLTIKGTGEMTSWSSYSSAPWYDYRNDIKTVVIEDEVTSIGNYAFCGCTNLTSITIPDSVTTIGRYAFGNCTSLTNVTIPNHVTSIWDDAFYGCTSLTNITIPDSVTSIGFGLFENCTSLTSVTIPNNITKIGERTFYNCESLTNITIPDSVTTIYRYAFYNCTSLTNVTITNHVASIGAYAFYNCKSLTSITIGNSVTSIGESVFSFCSSLTNVYYTGDIVGWCSINFNTYDSNPMHEARYLYIGGKPLDSELVIPNNITEIKDYTFYNCYSLTSVTIPDSVTSIGCYAFSGCANLTRITIPNNVTTIGEGAFSNCTSLTSVTIPSNATTLGERTFYNCASLKNITIPDRVTSIDDYAFFNCGLTTVTIPENVEYIGVDVFWGCKLTNISVSSNNACYSSDRYGVLFDRNKTKLILYPIANTRTSYTIPDSVITVGDYAFSYCENLTNITVGNSVTTIGEYAFYNCINLTKATVGNNVTTIATCAFYDCNSLTSVNIPDSVTTISDYAFRDCYSLNSISIPESITTINEGVFAYCTSLKSVTIPNNVKTIGEVAFIGCDSLASVNIGAGVTSIGGGAFNVCTALTKVYYPGTEEQWANISIDSYNEPLTSATIYYNYVKLETQSVNSEVSTFIAMPILNSVLNNSYVVSTHTTGAIIGNRYTLIALDQTAAEYDLANLAFIDHTLATGSDVSFNFMPKSADNLIMLIIGDFGSGIEQRVISGAPGVAVTDVRLSHTSLNLYPGQDAVQLMAYITPDNASIKDVIWTSSNTSVAAVDKNGVVTPYKPGEATITAISASDGITAECKVTVTARVFEISWIMPDGTYTVEYDEGESISEYENTGRTGYTFIGWDKTVPNRMPADNLEFTALYKANSYTAKFNTNGGKWADGTTAEKSVNVDFDSDIPVQPEPTKQGYVFAGWEYNGENLGTNVGKMISADGMAFTAVWVPAKDTRYTVNTYTMNEKGEYVLSEKVLTGTTNETVTLSPEIENGFELNEVKSVLSGKIAADNSLVLSVYIDRKTYTFTTVVDGKGRSVNYMYGEAVSEPETPTKLGHTFAGWDASVPQTMPAENIRLNAQWQINTYTVTWNANGKETVDTLNYGDKIVKPKNPSKEGYTFADWTPEVPATVPAENFTFYATWYVNSYDVTWTVDGKKTTESYEYGEEIAKPADPAKTGYTFIGWGADIPGTMPAKGLDFTAQWKINTYTVTWNADGKETVDTLNYGDEIVKPENPTKEGYTFIGWSPEIPATVPAENLTFTAQYELIVKQLKIKNPSTSTINYGETLVMHADFGGVELPEGWKIQWTVEGAGFNMAPADDGLTCNMISVANGNATVKATLVDENGEAVIDADGNEMSDSKNLTSKAGFWQKFVSFFKNLFRINRIIPE